MQREGPVGPRPLSDPWLLAMYSDALEGGAPRAPNLCPATVSLTPSASLKKKKGI